MWSLGNESGAGCNHRAMRRYIKQRDPYAIVHYENSHLEFKAVPPGEDYSDISDVESRMYASVDYIEKYLKDKSHTKPFFMCEYVCSMSTGDVYDYWDVAERYESFCGGCIWEFCDHAVNVPAPDGSPRYMYGGDFGDIPNDGICCIDGLVYPDRTPRPGYWDMKKVYEQCTAEYDGAGTVTVFNRRFFTALDDYSAVWRVTSQGEALLEGTVERIGTPARGKSSFKLFDPAQLNPRGNCFLTVSFVYAHSCPWAKQGEEAGFAQFELASGSVPQPVQKRERVEYSQTQRYITAQAGKVRFVYDKSYGRLIEYSVNGTQLLSEPSSFDIWRAPCYNGGSSERWHLEAFDRATQKTYESRLVNAGRDFIDIKTQLAIGGHSNPPVIRAQATWRFAADGSVTVCLKGTVRRNAPALARLGLLLTMPESFEKLVYFGLGPFETYPDRYKAALYDEYSLNVTDAFEHYIRPQENSSHFKTRSLRISDGSVSLSVTPLYEDEFSFTAMHYTAHDLADTRHDFELVQRNATYLNLDWRVNAISENAGLDTPDKKRLLLDKEFDFGFVLRPGK